MSEKVTTIEAIGSKTEEDMKMKTYASFLCACTYTLTLSVFIFGEAIHQQSNEVISSSLAMSYGIWRHRQRLN